MFFSRNIEKTLSLFL